MVQIIVSIQNGRVNSVVASSECEVIIRRPLGTQDFNFEHKALILNGVDGEDYEVYRLKPWINAKGAAFMCAELAEAEARQA